jgi:cytochrome oxidase assembly protein ShyY1
MNYSTKAFVLGITVTLSIILVLVGVFQIARKYQKDIFLDSCTTFESIKINDQDYTCIKYSRK